MSLLPHRCLPQRVVNKFSEPGTCNVTITCSLQVTQGTMVSCSASGRRGFVVWPQSTSRAAKEFAHLPAAFVIAVLRPMASCEAKGIPFECLLCDFRLGGKESGSRVVKEEPCTRTSRMENHEVARAEGGEMARPLGSNARSTKWYCIVCRAKRQPEGC